MSRLSLSARRLCLYVLAITLSLGGCQCSRTPDPEPTQSVRIAVEANPSSLDPIRVLDVNSYQLLVAAHAPLALVDEAGNIVPVIAQRIEMSNGATKCNIDLRPEAKFWNGKPVTAADVKYSFERLWKSPHPHKWILERIRRQPSADGTEPLQGIELMGDHRLVISFDEPDPDFVHFISSGLTAIVQTGSDATPPEPLDRHVIGCGPWKPADFQPGNRFRFERNNGFPHASSLMELTFLVLENTQDRLQAFRDREVDIIRLRGPMISEACQQSKTGHLSPRERFGNAALLSRTANELTMVLWNWKASPLANVRADQRKSLLAAASKAWSRETVVNDLYLGQATPTMSVVPPLVASSSYQWSQAEEHREVGKLTLVSANDPDSRRLASSIQSEFGGIGLQVEVSHHELPQLVQRVLEGKYDVSLFWVEQQIPASGPIPWMMFFREDSPFVAIGEPISGIGKRINEARGIIDSAERAAHFNNIVNDVDRVQTAFLPLLSRNIVLMFRPEIKGIHVDRNGLAYWTFLTAEEQ